MKKAEIIVVDDNKVVLRCLEKDLAGEPYTVFLAQSGEEALAIAAAHKGVKVIVSDVKMPNMVALRCLTR